MPVRLRGDSTCAHVCVDTVMVFVFERYTVPTEISFAPGTVHTVATF